MTAEPFLRIERGTLTDDEIVALTIVLAAAVADDAPNQERAQVHWLPLGRRPAFVPQLSWRAA
ncbi:acyl-CoA carboxylase epsilon subunit [Antrihabitans cavernicola]|uniref:Acyl-CoA carboxylase subunit epsilon n=1 Tax=Antrihabitans cavernicola TaxID=2495913 RepID=A0A5A7SBS6_9NOCA|nr:acyl-CoA carboxylase epsilon subunit [Spelaeibacter cavernicola]KAA0021681.1 acyl-CoA carboxylase subunit epsilon [Spelaeibacter cavernicola]